ncbi:MAG: BrnA antitoxin family protein [Terracidiphilus sp.]
MANRKPLTKAQPSPKPIIDDDGEVRELTAADVANFKPFSALPAAEQKVLLKLRRRGPQKTPRKIPVSIRLSPDVADGLRATGNGWQTRADNALRLWLSSQTESHS